MMIGQSNVFQLFFFLTSPIEKQSEHILYALLSMYSPNPQLYIKEVRNLTTNPTNQPPDICISILRGVFTTITTTTESSSGHDYRSSY